MLVEATDNDFERLIEGTPPDGLSLAEGGLEAPEVLAMLRGLATQVRALFTPAAWMMVDADEVVGLCSLLSAPDAAGAAPFGYGVAASRRSRGHARAAVRDLIAWAKSESRIRALTADTSIHNTPSQRVLEQNGFARIGERIDPEDGEMYRWRLDLG